MAFFGNECNIGGWPAFQARPKKQSEGFFLEYNKQKPITPIELWAYFIHSFPKVEFTPKSILL